VEAHYSKQGLPFTPPAVNSGVGTLQDSLREKGDAKRLVLGGAMRRSWEAGMRAPGRKEVAEEVSRQNKEFSRTDQVTGRVRMSAHKASETVSDAGSVPWTRTSTPWFLDPVLGEWVREDQVGEGRGGGVLGGRGALAYIMQAPNQVRIHFQHSTLPP